MESAEGPWDFGARLRAAISDWDRLWAALSDWDAPRLRELASRGADLRVRDAYGWPLPHKALEIARSRGPDLAAGMIRELLEMGCPPDVKTPHGWTALHASCLWGMPDCARALLEAGASPRARDRFGATPAHAAARGSGEAAAACLREIAGFGEDALTIEDNYGRLPIHWCAQEGGAEAMRELIGKAGRVDEPDRSGRVPLLMAATQHYQTLSVAAEHEAWKPWRENAAAGVELLRAGADEALALKMLPTLPSYPELREEVQGTLIRWRSLMEREEMERLARAPSRKSKPRSL